MTMLFCFETSSGDRGESDSRPGFGIGVDGRTGLDKTLLQNWVLRR